MAVGAAALLGVVIVQHVGPRAALSDEGLRFAAFTAIVVGKLAMLQWFRRSGGAARPQAKRVFLLLVGGVGALAVLLTPALRRALGLPA